MSQLGGLTRKGGHNGWISQIKTRPAPPAPMKVPRLLK